MTNTMLNDETLSQLKTFGQGNAVQGAILVNFLAECVKAKLADVDFTAEAKADVVASEKMHTAISEGLLEFKNLKNFAAHLLSDSESLDAFVALTKEKLMLKA